MTRIICKKCYWGDKCSEINGCDYYDPLYDNEIFKDKTPSNREQYNYEYQTYLAVWAGTDKWGDGYDQ